MKYWLFVILLILISCSNNAEFDHNFLEKEYYSINKKLELYQTASIINDLNFISDIDLKKAIEFEATYLTKGVLIPGYIDSLRYVTNPKKRAIYHFSYGDLLIRKPKAKDSIGAYEQYKTALSLAQKENDSVLIFSALRRINEYHQNYGGALDSFERYHTELRKYATQDSDAFWVEYFNLNIKLLKQFKNHLPPEAVSDEDFNTLRELALNDPYLIGIVYQFQGIFYDLILKNGKISFDYFKKAEQNYRSSHLAIAKESLHSLNISKSASAYRQGFYRKSINNLRSTFNSFSNSDIQPLFQERQFTSHWLAKAYEKIGKLDSSQYFLKQERIFKEYNDEYSRSIELYTIDKHFDVKEKDIQISSLQRLKREFIRHKWIYGVSMFLIFLLAVYSFFRWFRIDKSNKRLIKKNEEVTEEVRFIKELVIKDHIILKNKTKVLLEELIYIKSEDHYLSLFTLKKREFVRGKLSDLEKELPPNFSRCHRSYIINRNYIQSISMERVYLENKTFVPVSRSYKKRFLKGEKYN